MRQQCISISQYPAVPSLAVICQSSLLRLELIGLCLPAQSRPNSVEWAPITDWKPVKCTVIVVIIARKLSAVASISRLNGSCITLGVHCLAWPTLSVCICAQHTHSLMYLAEHFIRGITGNLHNCDGVRHFGCTLFNLRRCSLN